MVLSSEADTNKFLVGCHATLLTEAVCPESILIRHSLSLFHIYILQSIIYRYIDIKKIDD